ncbi:hypothetical protein NQZ68_033252 [Dissostichus eleginoides]|nr:hypothetical protein NQZ68_033252 [Dissostichus eleginoides]
MVSGGVLHCCNEVQTRCTWGRKCLKAPVQQQKREASGVLHCFNEVHLEKEVLKSSSAAAEEGGLWCGDCCVSASS